MVLFDAKREIIFSTLNQDRDREKIILEIQGRSDLYLSEKNCSFPLIANESLYTITVHPLSYEDVVYTLFVIAKKPLLFDPEDKVVSFYSDFSETTPDSIFDNSANLVGSTSGMLEKFAATSLPVLIVGETGTGKEKAAALLYRYGSYRDKPFFVIDCTLMTDKKWKILLNSPGSPFNEVNSSIHIKNVEHLSNSQLESFYEYVEGSNFLKRNRVTFSLVASDAKAEDIRNYLLNRLSCLLFPLIPLRERIDDISNIAALYINQMNISLGKQIIGFEDNALQLIRDYRWPRNLDQFHRVLKELILITDNAYITADNVKMVLSHENPVSVDTSVQSNICLDKTLDEITFDIIIQVLREENGNKEKAAKRLGISRTTLWRILKNNT